MAKRGRPPRLAGKILAAHVPHDLHAWAWARARELDVSVSHLVRSLLRGERRRLAEDRGHVGIAS